MGHEQLEKLLNQFFSMKGKKPTAIFSLCQVAISSSPSICEQSSLPRLHLGKFEDAWRWEAK